MEIFSQEDQEKIIQAISIAESHTSGEIRLVVERKCKDDSPYDVAKKYFEKLHMHETTLRNGILIYLATEDHKFAIIGDSGIHERVDDGFWDGVREHMVDHFRSGNLTEGLIAGITETGEQLRHFFPKRIDDVNELPDDIYFGEN